MKTYESFINGKWQSARSGQLREIRDPANGELVAKVQESGKEDVIQAIDAARKAFDAGPWRKTSALDR
jgi:betaine-aldehyde dehydrogenase